MPPPPSQSRFWPLYTTLIAHAALALPLILTQHLRGRFGGDHINYHLKVIRTFIEQWPRPDLHDYLSATTPLYHLILAFLGVFLSDDPRFLQTVGMLFTLGLHATLGLYVCRRLPPMAALACLLPLAASIYVFPAGVWLLPDNPAWWGVLAILLLALRGTFNAKTALAGGAILLALVLTRQIHAWAAGTLCLAAWLSVPSTRQGLVGLIEVNAARLKRTALAVAACIPAVFALVYFYDLWGGLQPPTFQSISDPNPITPGFLLATWGALSIFFAGYWLPGLGGIGLWPVRKPSSDRPALGPQIDDWASDQASIRIRRAIYFLILLAALLLSAIPESFYSVPYGRYSGLWNAVDRLPTLANRSPFIIALALLGALSLTAWLSRIPTRQRAILALSLLGFTAAQTVGHYAWQRYTEPFLLILAAIFASLTPTDPRPFWSKLRVLALLALSMLLAMLTANEVLRGKLTKIKDTRIGPDTKLGVPIEPGEAPAEEP